MIVDVNEHTLNCYYIFVVVVIVVYLASLQTKIRSGGSGVLFLTL